MIIKVDPLCREFENRRKQNVYFISLINQSRLYNEDEYKQSALINTS